MPGERFEDEDADGSDGCRGDDGFSKAVDDTEDDSLPQEACSSPFDTSVAAASAMVLGVSFFSFGKMLELGLEQPVVEPIAVSTFSAEALLCLPSPLRSRSLQSTASFRLDLDFFGDCFEEVSASIPPFFDFDGNFGLLALPFLLGARANG